MYEWEDRVDTSTVEVNQDLIAEAGRLGVGIAMDSGQLVEKAEAEATKAKQIFEQRAWGSVELVEEEQMRAQEHLHWLRAAQLRWLALNASERSDTYAEVRLHRFLAMKWLKLSDLRWIAQGWRQRAPSRLSIDEWLKLEETMEEVRELLLRVEETGYVTERVVGLHLEFIEMLVDQCG